MLSPNEFRRIALKLEGRHRVVAVELP